MPLVRMTVNGRPVGVEVGEEETLLDVLRDKLGLMGAKNGCGKGHCGACTVLVDGEARRSCVVRAGRLEGADVLTIEGLAAGGQLHPVQRAFIEAGAIQCGFCTPGMIMSVVGLLRKNPDPSDSQVREALKHNLCRCTGYASILRAVRLAVALQKGERGEAPTSAMRPGQSTGIVGSSVARVGAEDRVTGRPIFAADLVRPGMLHGKLLFAEYPHAEILSIDTSEAEAAPGVEAVMTARDIPGRNAFGLLVVQQPVLAADRVRHLGDPVAVVFAETARQAERAAAKIKVEYRPLPAVFSPDEALAEGAPILHEEGNVMHRVVVRKGDVEAAFRGADVVVEGEYRTPAVEHAYLEPEAALAAPGPDGSVTVWTGSQGSHAFRSMIAASLGVAEAKVRVIYTPCGGGFGGKEEPTVQIHCALGALRLGRPVKMVLSREESIRMSTKRHAEVIRMRHGATRDGRLVAMQARIVADTGAYASLGKPVVFRSAVVAAGPYEIPNVDSEAIGVYTNNPVGGAFRGFGSTQVAFASEVQMDKLACELGLDPIELRRRNALREGAETATAQVLGPGTAYLETLEAVAGRLADLRANAVAAGAASGRGAGHRKIGLGVASAYKNVGIGTGKRDGAGAIVGLTEGGRILVRVGATDMGQGSDTVMAQLAADVIGCDLGLIDVLSSDTALCPDGEETTASRQTYITGNAVVKAAEVFRDRLIGLVSELYGAGSEAAAVSGDSIVAGGRRVALTEVAEKARVAGRKVEADHFYVAPATYPLRVPADRQAGQDPHLWDVHFAYSFGTQAAAVAVDEETGEVEVLGVVAAHDIGRAINPQAVRGQVEGGIVMGLGYALSEGLQMEKGRIVNDNLQRLRVPRVAAAPPMDVIVVEKPEPGGPFGAKGMGELATNPTAPAIINAIHDAVGVYLSELPATREKIMAALAARKERR